MNERHGEIDGSAPAAWIPTERELEAMNVSWLMQRVGVSAYADLHAWSVQNREAYWSLVIERLGIAFRRPCSQMLDISRGVENAVWLPGARLNIVESCFDAPRDSVAIISQAEGGPLRTTTVGELETLTDRVSGGLVKRGFKPGDAIAIVMPMTAEAVAIYLGIVKAGCVVVGIAESFRPKEIAARLRLGHAVGVFTQDVLCRGGKEMPLFATVAEADAPAAIVLSATGRSSAALRTGDCSWEDFLAPLTKFAAVERQSSDHLNILFSSGTTGEPKAIPWTQTTPLKCAADAHFHHDVHAGDVLVWPTSLGWMMGPWLIFASLLNKAAIGLFEGLPTTEPFGRFVEASRATMLGVVPTIVQKWRTSGCMDGCDWQSIRLLSSTGECSSAEDMRWLMARAGGKPIIEYCGGTEIGGGYIANTMALPCMAGTFNTPTLGLDVIILDDDGDLADSGELFIAPPSIGLSTTLLNRDHHNVYYADTPKGPSGETLRRHGDRMEKLPDGTWRALGRADDTMNLGGIKVSSAEIEQVLRAVAGVQEVAAIAVAPGGGPSQLVIFAVVEPRWNQAVLLKAMQDAIRRDLNPLFKIHDLVLVDELPRTASNKVMRRALRDRF